MRAYKHRPIDRNTREIRLLTLLPGPFAADAHIDIHHAVLGKDNPPIYEALSYVWGLQANPVKIKVGSAGKEALEVTQNLASAFSYLRYEDKARVLRIDAICAYSHQTVMKHRGNLRFTPQFCAGSICLGAEKLVLRPFKERLDSNS